MRVFLMELQAGIKRYANLFNGTADKHQVWESFKFNCRETSKFMRIFGMGLQIDIKRYANLWNGTTDRLEQICEPLEWDYR
jgi:hypothetical protein